MFEELFFFGGPFVSGFSGEFLVFFLSVVMDLVDELFDLFDH